MGGARDSPYFTRFFLDEFSKPMDGKLLGLTNRLPQFAARREKRRPGPCRRQAEPQWSYG